MERINYNKNVDKTSEVIAGLFSDDDKKWGQIVICNDIEEPGLYIFTKNELGEQAIQKVNSVDSVVLDEDIDSGITGQIETGDTLYDMVSKLQNQINSLSGDTGNEVEKLNHVVIGVELNPDGTYKAISGNYVASATSISDAISKLDTAIGVISGATLTSAKNYTDTKVNDSINLLSADIQAVNGGVFTRLKEVNGVISGDVKTLSVSTDSTGLHYDLKLGDYVFGSINIPQGQFLSGVTFISAATAQDVAEAASYGVVIELGKPYLEFVWNLGGGVIAPTYIDISSLINIYDASGINLSNNYSGTSFNIQSGTSIEDSIGRITDELVDIENNIGQTSVVSDGNTILIIPSTGLSGTSIDVNIDNETIISDSTQQNKGKLSVSLSINKQDIVSGYIKTQYTLKSETGEYGIINDTRDIVVGDGDGFINVSTEQVTDLQGIKTDKITITPTIQPIIDSATSSATTDGNGLVTAWGIKSYIRNGMDGDDIMAGDDDLTQQHPVEYWRGKINFDSQSSDYDSVHGAFYKTDNNMELLDRTIGLPYSGQSVHLYPSAITQNCSIISGDTTIMDSLVSLDAAIGGMNYSANTGVNQVITGITQENGQIEVTSGNLTNRKLAGYAVGGDAKVASTDTLGQALGKLQGQINAMDYSADTSTDKVLTYISEEDGKVSVSGDLITNRVITGYAVGSDVKVSSTNNLGQALGNLQAQIDAMDLGSSANTNQVITDVTQTDGKISHVYSNITSRKLSGYSTTADTKVAASQTLGVALGNLQGQINAMDYSANTSTDKVFTYISEVDGKVSVSADTVGNRILSDYVVGSNSKLANTDSIKGAFGKLQGQINAMDYSANTSTDKVFTYISEVDGKVSVSGDLITNRVITGYASGSTGKVEETDSLGVAISKLQGQFSDMDYSASTSTNKVFTYIKQEDGKITVSADTVGKRVITGYAVGSDAKVAATDTINGAFGKLQGQINAMDASSVAEVNSLVSDVTQTDGKISVTTKHVVDVKLSGFTQGSSNSYVNSAMTLGEALGSLQLQIDEMDKGASSAAGMFVRTVMSDDGFISEDKTYITSSDVKIASATTEELATLGSNVREAYKLVNHESTKLGDWIKIYKDSSIVEIYLGTSGDTINATTGVITKKTGDKESLNYAYYTINGTYSLTKINLEDFLMEPEFKSGITVTNHVAHGVVDSTSESFLTVGANGFKLSGVQTAIDNAVGALDSTSATTSNKYAITAVTITNGKIAGIGQTNLVSSASTAANAAKVASKTVGNADGNVPLSNGTKNTNLNADMIDGYHIVVGSSGNTENTIYIL